MARGRRSQRDTLGRLATELAKFGAVGTVAFFVDLAVYNALAFTIMDNNPIGAKVVAVAVSTIVSWLGSRYWTFKEGAAKSAPKELFWFVMINFGGLVIAAMCLVVSHYLMGMTSKLADNVSANFIGLALGNIFRFFMYKYLLYKIPSRRIASSTAPGRADAENSK